MGPLWQIPGLAEGNASCHERTHRGEGTVHLELFYQEGSRPDRAPAWDRKTCVIVDEAAMLDTRTYARLMRHAAETGAKVVLVGDDRQHASVERDGMYSGLKERHGSTIIGRVRRRGSARSAVGENTILAFFRRKTVPVKLLEQRIFLRREIYVLAGERGAHVRPAAADVRDLGVG